MILSQIIIFLESLRKMVKFALIQPLNTEIMATFTLDTNLPSHGKRAKVDNVGTIRVKITRSEGLIYTMGPGGFELYLNIQPAEGIYHVTLESEGEDFRKPNVQDIEVPAEVLEEIVALSQNKNFMSLKNDDIFPDMMMLDGNDVTISVKTDAGNVSLDSNMLEDTLWDGIIPVADGEIQTPFSKLAAIAFNLLGIEPDEYEEEE